MRRFSSVALVALLVLSVNQATVARAQQNLITVGPNILVSGDEPKRPHVEPFLAANPKNSQHLIAASIAYLRPDSFPMCTAFTSFDGGHTWTRRELPGLKDQFFMS